MKQAVLFDLYGTLIDIETDEHDLSLFEILSKYLGYHGVSISPGRLKGEYFGRIKESLQSSEEPYPEVDLFRVFSSIMRDYGKGNYSRRTIIDLAMLFRSLSVKRFTLFPGVIETLITLQEKYRLALISDAQWVFTEPEMAMSGLDRFFECVVLSSRFAFKKPDPRLFCCAVDRLGLEPAECIYVGDNPAADLVGATRAGMGCIMLSSQCVSHDGYKPDACLARFDQLEQAVRKIF